MAIFRPVADFIDTSCEAIEFTCKSVSDATWQDMKEEFNIKGDPRAILFDNHQGTRYLYINPDKKALFIEALDDFGVRVVAE
jgi:archaellum component FlaG (FlaF/FlaG flagellin family)